MLIVECFFEELHRDDKMTVTFLSGPGTEGNHDIEFWVHTLFLFKGTLVDGRLRRLRGIGL